MRVLVYVEGRSDQEALQALLAPLLAAKLEQGIEIRFVPSLAGDAKKYVACTVPLRAVDILRNDPDAIVVALPDLYPRNKGFDHQTPEELFHGMREQFESKLRHDGLGDDDRLRARFHVFCLKHDLEALLLAADDALARFLGAKDMRRTWASDVEDQNQDSPPKRIVEQLFQAHGRRYAETANARAILEGYDYRLIAQRCPQCFAPFVAFLEGLTAE